MRRKSMDAQSVPPYPTSTRWSCPLFQPQLRNLSDRIRSAKHSLYQLMYHFEKVDYVYPGRLFSPRNPSEAIGGLTTATKWSQRSFYRG